MAIEVDGSNTIVVMFDFDTLGDTDDRCSKIASWIRTNVKQHVEVESRVWLIVKSEQTIDELFGKIVAQFGAGDCVAMFKVASMMLNVDGQDELFSRLKRRN